MPNFYAQIVFCHVFFILIDFGFLKFQQTFPLNNFGNETVENLKKMFFWNRNNRLQNKKYNGKCTILYCFLTIWVLMSVLLLEPASIFVLMLNFLLEYMMHFVLSPPHFLIHSITKRKDIYKPGEIMYKQLFYRLGLYHLMAYSSFYQLGNRNSLSTINVGPCFVGLNDYWPSVCAMFMIISTYSSFIFWLLMFFIRLQEDFFRHDDEPRELLSINQNNDDEIIELDDKTTIKLSIRNKIVTNYQTFLSIINVILLIQFIIMSIDMLITWILQDHLFIWSIICPKFIYEFAFTLILSLFTFLISICFTVDNYFLLDDFKMKI